MERNRRLVDGWSLLHVAAGVALTLVAGPFPALLLLTAWEPFEVLVLSPWLKERGVAFGREGWQNSLMDVLFNAAGVAVGHYVVTPRWDPLGVAGGGLLP